MDAARSLDRRILSVVQAGNCSGCGACCLLDAGLAMSPSGDGFVRPAPTGAPRAPLPNATRLFDRACPGRQVRAGEGAGVRHPTLGSVLGAWQAWAADPEFRHRGSSGGVLSALNAWLVTTGEATRVTAAAKDGADPRRTTVRVVRDREGASATAGSRYAPVGCAAAAPLGDRGAVFVGKPCEASAVRALGDGLSTPMPLVLSFFCAGTPSQTATDGLVHELSAGEAVNDLWYRGRGWPGRFTVTLESGRTPSVTYDQSWGERLGPSMQWRCKICPDGVGESADIVAADFWDADESGYPVFTEQDGVSALLARTPRGLDVVRRAIKAGVIVAGPLELDDLARVQPFQVTRRSTLAARLLGTRLAGRAVPRYRGFGLWRLALRDPGRAVRVALGSFRRVRGSR